MTFSFDSSRFIDPLYDKRLVFLPFPLETRTLKVSAVYSIRIQTRRSYICARHTRAILLYEYMSRSASSSRGKWESAITTYTMSLRRLRSGYFCPSIAISRFRATLYPRADLNKKEGERKNRTTHRKKKERYDRETLGE